MLEIKCVTPKEPYGSNSYIICSADEYAIIDPSVSFADAVKECKLEDKQLKYIIVTHAHFDHMLYIDSWCQKGAEVYVGAPDQDSLSDSYKNCYSLFLGEDKGYQGNSMPIDDNDVLKLGEDEIKIISVPGHTPGGIALFSSDILLCGDTIFANGYGRYDLPGGDPKLLVRSIEKLLSLPEDTRVYSGHGAPSTICEVKRYLNF